MGGDETDWLSKRSNDADHEYVKRCLEQDLAEFVSTSSEVRLDDLVPFEKGRPNLQAVVQLLVEALKQDDSGISFYRLSWSPGAGVYEYVERNTPNVKKAPRSSASPSRVGGSPPVVGPGSIRGVTQSRPVTLS